MGEHRWLLGDGRRRGASKTGERPRDAQVCPHPGQDEKNGLKHKRFALGNVQADGAAPETTGQQDAQGRGARDEEEKGADEFPGTNHLNRHAQAELLDLLRSEEAEDLGGTREEHDSANQAVQHPASDSFPIPVRFHSSISFCLHGEQNIFRYHTGRQASAFTPSASPGSGQGRSRAFQLRPASSDLKRPRLLAA